MRRLVVIGLLAMTLIGILGWADSRPLLVSVDANLSGSGSNQPALPDVGASQAGSPSQGADTTSEPLPLAMWDLNAVQIPFADLKSLVPSMETLAGGAAYRVAEGQWGGAKQKVHVLTVDPASETLRVRPVLSFNRLFGFETLSEMAGRKGALAAVNGGFADTDGRPSGTVMITGELLHPADKRFPTLILGKDQAGLTVLETVVSVQLGGETLLADGFNPWPAPTGLSVFTPAYGSAHRMDRPHLAIQVSAGNVLRIMETTGSVSIPTDGFVLAAVGTAAREALLAHCTVGDPIAVAVEYFPELPSGTLDAMSCGSFLVQGGVSVVPERDIWVGPMNGPAPRTVVGLGSQGQLVFVVAEGRIQDGPSGFTGKGLGELLVGMGLEEAAMLDGGASSELIVGGRVKNRLSAGSERLLPSGFVLQEIAVP